MKQMRLSLLIQPYQQSSCRLLTLRRTNTYTHRSFKVISNVVLMRGLDLLLDTLPVNAGRVTSQIVLQIPREAHP